MINKRALKHLARLVETSVRIQDVNERETGDNYQIGVLAYHPVKEDNALPRFSVDKIDFTASDVEEAYDNQENGIGLVYVNFRVPREVQHE